MTYDPNLVEDWVVGLSGFWRKGNVNPSEHNVPFRGTWEQVVARCDEMRAMEQRHEEEARELLKRQIAERVELYGRGKP